MRQVGTLQSEQHARRFADYLMTLGISAQADHDGDGWAIWVREEEQVEQAARELKDFRANPQDARYAGVENHAEKIRREQQEKRRRAQKNVIEMRGSWGRGMGRAAPGVFVLIAASVLVFMLSGMTMNTNNRYVRMLMYGDPAANIQAASGDSFADIKQGQVWRLVTPIFLHGSWMHLVFNMYMLYYLGGQMENRRGWWRLMLFVLVTAIFSNTAEVLINATSNEVACPVCFGGMSGVDYALFGYVWMRARYDSGSGFYISQFTIILLIAWFFIGFTGWMPIANAAHAGGLFLGVVIGYLPVMFPALRNKL